jgi:predicted DNA-binding transcriptional regulator YafY
MRRADRLFDIVQRLRGGRLVTARALAERLEVSERTIYRDIADLIGSGVPIEGEAGVGYVMRGGYDLPPLMFTRAEVEAVALGLRMAATYGGAQTAASAHDALAKIEAVLPADLARRLSEMRLYALEHDAPLYDKAILDVVDDAIRERRRIAFGYVDAGGQISDRLVRPLALTFWGKVWTLAAWCETRCDFRVFRPDRMSGVGARDGFPRESGREWPDFLKATAHA